MGIEWRKSVHGEKVLHVIGPFDFSCHKDFLQALKDSPNAASASVINLDLSGTTSLDSAGLGLLLILRNHLKAQNKEVALVNCSSIAKKNLLVANFHKQFLVS